MIFETQVVGVPCQCSVINYEPSVPMRIYGPGNGDADPPEGAVFDFDILTRKGKRSPWLERHLNRDDPARLQDEFLNTRRAEDYGFY